MNKLNAKNILLALLAILMIFAMGIFKGQIYCDRTFHKFSLKEGTNNTYVVDVGKMGIVKYLVQPNIMTVYLRIKVPAEVKALRCEVDGIENFASQGSKKGVWKKLTTADFFVEGQWGAFAPLNIEIAVPRMMFTGMTWLMEM